MADAVKLGKQIQLLRQRKKMTQVQLAQRLNISYQSVSKWENGVAMPTKSLLMDIAKNLETSVDFIMQE